MLKLILLCISALSTPIVQAQQVAATANPTAPISLPTELSGTWYTPDHRYSREWKITKINQADGSGLVTFGSTQPACRILVDVPAKVEFDGSTLRISFADQKYRLCTEKFVAELQKTDNGFEGKIWSGTSYNPTYSVLTTTIK